MGADGRHAAAVLEHRAGAQSLAREPSAPAPRGVREPEHAARAALIDLLSLAYSGELAAAYAYRGHARALAPGADRRAIETIEREEWHHRALVGDMLAQLGARSRHVREWRAALIGRVLGALCHVTGWLAPMYGAGRLESRNIREYESAARLARAAGREEWVECLLTMAEVEWEHERFFRSKVLAHRWAERLPLWPAPPPKETIRASARAWDATRS